jgi:hypothetical protein
MKKKTWSLWPLLISSLLLSGCGTTITNLTPSTLKRNQNGLYPFEVEFDTTQRTIRSQTLQPYVLIGAQAYPMQPAPMLKNRWETLIPVPGNKDYVSYRFKFNYEYNSIPHPHRGSKLSSPYQVRIVDR